MEAGGLKGASCLLEVSGSHTGDSLRVVKCVFLFQSRETREILHFHYTTWPDFGVPESPASFLNFLFKVRESGSLSREHGPVVVHCSAGIGRSGTFCLADTCLLLVRRPSGPQEAEGACSDLQAGLAVALCHCLQSASFGLDFLAASLPSRSFTLNSFIWSSALNFDVEARESPSLTLCVSCPRDVRGRVVPDADSIQLCPFCGFQMDKRKDPSSVDIKKVLLEMRKFRMGLIQTADQLRFSYLAVIEGAKFIMGDSSVQVSIPSALISGVLVLNFCL